MNPPEDRELVDPVDALDPAQLRRAVQGEPGHARCEERQRLFEFGPGQVSARAVVGTRAEGEQPALARRGDVEALAVLALAVGPFRADRDDRARGEDDVAMLDLLQADPRGERRDGLEAQHLLDRARDQGGIARQQRPLVRVLREQPYRVRDLAGMVARLTGAPVEFVANPRNEARENELAVCNQTLISLGLDPITLETGLMSDIVGTP